MESNTIKAIIVDDEPGCISNLQFYLTKYCPGIEVIATGSSLADVSRLFTTNIDIAFLDIEIYDDNIFKALDHLKCRDISIVFVTAYERYALKAFKVDAIDYLLKPLSEADITECYRKIMKHTQNRQFVEDTGHHTLQAKVSRKIILKQGEQVFVIKQNDIYYLKAKGFYTEVFFDFKGNTSSVLVSKPLSIMEKEYENECFFRMHRSYVVNTNKVASVLKGDKTLLKLNNGVFLPIAKRRASEFLFFLNDKDEV